MIPVGGIYALNGDEAKTVVEQLKPKEYIFPMHCGTPIYDDLLTADEFLMGAQKKRVVLADDNRITLVRNPAAEDRWVSPWQEGSDATRPLIVRLHYWPKNGPAPDPKKEPEPKK